MYQHIRTNIFFFSICTAEASTIRTNIIINVYSPTQGFSSTMYLTKISVKQLKDY